MIALAALAMMVASVQGSVPPEADADFLKGAWSKSMALSPKQPTEERDNRKAKRIDHAANMCHLAPPPKGDGLFFLPAMHRYCASGITEIRDGQAHFTASCRVENGVLELEGDGSYSTKKFSIPVTARLLKEGQVVQYVGSVSGRRTGGCSAPR
jgi:hypothetical protein